MHVAASSIFLGIAASAAPEVANGVAEAATHDDMGMGAGVRIPLVMVCGLIGGWVVVCGAAQREGITVKEKLKHPIGHSTLVLSAMTALFTSQLLPRAVSLLGGASASVDLAMALAFLLGMFAYTISSGVAGKLFGGSIEPSKSPRASENK